MLGPFYIRYQQWIFSFLSTGSLNHLFIEKGSKENQADVERKGNGET